MDEAQILARLQELVRRVLESPSVVLSRESVATEIPYWDSLAHVRIMVETERVFGIRFEVEELNSFDNVGGLVDAIAMKL